MPSSSGAAAVAAAVAGAASVRVVPMKVESGPSWMLKRPAEDQSGARAQLIGKIAKTGAKASDDDIRGLVKVLTRLTLANASEIRDLTGACYHAWILKESDPVCKALVAVGNQYHTEVSKDPKGHTLGPPFLHAWVRLAEALGSDDRVDPKDKQALQQCYQARVMQEAREVLENDVRHCRLKST